MEFGIRVLVVRFIPNRHHSRFVLLQQLQHHFQHVLLFLGYVGILTWIVLDVEEAWPVLDATLCGLSWLRSARHNSVFQRGKGGGEIAR